MSAGILLAHVRRDGGTQIRAALDEATVLEYAEAYRHQTHLPPLVVFFDGTDHWLGGGFHRVEAALQAGLKRLPADIRKGTQRDAILFACGDNAEHGLRRSNADKRRAVDTLLADPEWRAKSDAWIAKTAKVHRDTVTTRRAEVAETVDLVTVRHGLDGKQYKIRDSGGNGAQGEPATPIAMGTSRTTAETPAEVRRESSGGDEGAGSGVTGKADAAPAPDEPASPGPDEEAWFEEQRNPRPCVDMHGLSAGIEWVRDVNALAAAVDAFDGHLRQAQSVLAPMLSREDAVAMVAPLREAARKLAADGRKSARPTSVCLYCKDPDGTAGRREGCNGCRGLGWLTEEHLIAIPSELVGSDKVIDQKVGGFVPTRPQLAVTQALIEVEKARRLRVELVDEFGESRAFDEDDSGTW